MAKSNQGTWIDTESGEVVTSPPVEGVQLISPNVEEPTPAELAAVEAAKAALVEVETVVETVTTEAVVAEPVAEETSAEGAEEDLVDDKPAGNASTEEWRAYAIAQGLAEDDVAEMGRDEIRARFA